MGHKKKGIPRDEALAPLSRHHHHALFMALKLKRAGTEKSRFSIEQILDDLQQFWDPGGQVHFREEEEILLPAASQYMSVERPEITEMLLEHVKIRASVGEILGSNDYSISKLNDLGELLETHVRKEERIIFPMIEEHLPREKLDGLAPLFHE